VLITTTTHIRPPACETLLRPSPEAVRAAFDRTNLLAAGDPAEGGKLTEAQALRGAYDGLADYALIEADGSRGLPLKAPAAHEPVLPDGAALVVAMAGMACAGQTIRDAAHRPALYAALCGLPEDARVTPEAVACVLMHPMGQQKGVPARFAVVLNQADTPQRLAFARAVAAGLAADVAIMALQSEPDFVELWHNGKHLIDT
jgi:probable selenium-dependent hydroxylase accessory protein YqeC